MNTKLLIALFVAFLSFQATARERLNFEPDGRFRIVQFTDIHYVPGNEESTKAVERMAVILDREDPQLVVLTGDIVVQSPAQQGWDAVLQPMIDRQIPYAVVFGNHDDEHDWTRRQIMDYISRKPFCVSEAGPEEVTGVGNYVVDIEGEGGGAELYFMDSGAYTPIKGVGHYAWFAFDQVEWFRAQSGRVHKPSLAFFHIPLREYMELSDVKNPRPENEPMGSGVLNTGMFAAMVESGDMMGVFVGHDHNNDYIGLLHGIYLGYGRFSGGRTTYTDIGSGARIIDLSDGAHTFETRVI